MASQRFCLRWNNHQSNLLSVFDQLFHAETFTDVTLAIDGQCLKAHKVLIIIICSSFRMLFVFHFFFFVIRKRVNQVELFIIFKSLFFFFSFVPFFGDRTRRVFYLLLIKFGVSQKKKMSDYDTFVREQARKMSHRKVTVSVSLSLIHSHIYVVTRNNGAMLSRLPFFLRQTPLGIIEGEDFRSKPDKAEKKKKYEIL